MKLTKTNVERAKVPASGKVYYWDAALKGFGIRVTYRGVRSYVVQARIGSTTRRETIGRHGVLTAEVARKRAKKMLGDMAAGKDPRVERQRAAASSVTLREVWEEYRTTRRRDGKDRKASTLADIESHRNRNFKKWMDCPVASIKPEAVLRKHREIEKRGPYQADQAARYLRLLINFARDRHNDPNDDPVIPSNPVDILRRARRWNAPERRRVVIPQTKLGATIVALEDMATTGWAVKFSLPQHRNLEIYPDERSTSPAKPLKDPRFCRKEKPFAA